MNIKKCPNLTKTCLNCKHCHKKRMKFEQNVPIFVSFTCDKNTFDWFFPLSFLQEPELETVMKNAAKNCHFHITNLNKNA